MGTDRDDDNNNHGHPRAGRNEHDEQAGEHGSDHHYDTLGWSLGQQVTIGALGLKCTQAGANGCRQEGHEWAGEHDATTITITCSGGVDRRAAYRYAAAQPFFDIL
jgi:hypothetical protein